MITESKFKSKRISCVSVFCYLVIVALISHSLSAQEIAGNEIGKPDSVRTERIEVNPFADLDNYAKNVPEHVSKNLKSLAKYLSLRANNDTEKARLVFSWVAHHIRYDDVAYNRGTYSDEKPATVLKRRLAVCAGYSALFESLAKEIGLEVKVISGYAKGYGNERHVAKINHDWNAVQIDGEWKLIDVTWGSSSSKRTKNGLKTSLEFNDFWFFTLPELFAFSHLPENSRWQLIRDKLSLNEFNNLPDLNYSLLKMGFSSISIFEVARSEGAKEFVEIKKTRYPYKIIETPLAGPLTRGKPYTFSFMSDKINQMEIEDSGKFTPFLKEGNVFRLNYTPKGKVLYIKSKMNSNPYFDDIIAVYRISESAKQ